MFCFVLSTSVVSSDAGWPHAGLFQPWFVFLCRQSLKGPASDDQPSMLPKEQPQTEKTHQHPGDDHHDDSSPHDDADGSPMTQRQATPGLFRSSSPAPTAMRESPMTVATGAATSSPSLTTARGLTAHKMPSPRKPESAQPGIGKTSFCSGYLPKELFCCC